MNQLFIRARKRPAAKKRNELNGVCPEWRFPKQLVNFADATAVLVFVKTGNVFVLV
jgi:hypothetical protein